MVRIFGHVLCVADGVFSLVPPGGGEPGWRWGAWFPLSSCFRGGELVGYFGLEMPCFFPLKAYHAPGGGVVFSSKAGWSDRPLDLPCGQCRGCRAERARQWALRVVHEAQMHPANSFVTLTYDNKHLPPDGGLHVSDWQKFAKRLRKCAGPFRFFHCGEYGDVNQRPHYHACIFGMDFSGDRTLLRRSGPNSLYVSAKLNDLWGLGYCVIGNLTYESAAYVARYCLKKVTGVRADAEYSRVDPVTGEVFKVRPPYVTMSRRPGVGSKWFDKFSSEVYPADEVVHSGRKFRPPRFYDNKLSAFELQRLKDKRVARVMKRKEELTPERLAVRAECADARLSSFRRSL